MKDMNSQPQMSQDMGEAVDPRYENERYLLGIIKTQLGITDEDMRNHSIVRAKVRESNIDKVLAK